MRLSALAVLATALVLGWSAHAWAGTIYLSQASSDQTSPDVLSASVEFDVDTSPGNLLITLVNNSEYNINQLFFNTSDNVTSLILTGPTSWGLYESEYPPDGPTQADGFGAFDYALKDDAVAAGASATFTLSIICGGDCVQVDFVGSPPDFNGTQSFFNDDYRPAQVAAKFVNGPAENDITEFDEDSAFGASNDEGFPAVPEPTTLALLGLGLLGLSTRGLRGHRTRE